MNFKHVVQAPEQGGGAGAGGAGGGGAGSAGTGAVQITPAEARTFVSGFVDDPKLIEAWDDKKVLEYHGKLNATLDKVRPKGAPPSTWPDNWRDLYAAGDDKKSQRLARYGSPAAVIDSLLTLQQRIGAGELRSTLPKDADAATLKAWREEQGIPEEPAKYALKLKDGLVIGEDDKPYIEAFLKRAHPAHITNAQASTFVEAYYEIIEQQAAERAADDTKAAQDAINALAAEWGGEYKPNMNMVHGLLDAAPPGVKDMVLAGRGPDGKPLMASAEFIRWMNGMSREINPVTTVVPNAGANIGTAIDDEIKAIEKQMADRQGPYYKGPIVNKEGREDTVMAHRYTELLDARERVKKKAA